MDIRTYMTAALASCSLLVNAACAGSAQQAARRPAVSYPLPAIKQDCTTCHVPSGSEKQRELKKGFSQLCLDCHGDRRAPAEHAVDIVPTMQVVGLPLTEGRMTCVTCHDPHKNANRNMLRLPARSLCLACHRV